MPELYSQLPNGPDRRRQFTIEGMMRGGPSPQAFGQTTNANGAVTAGGGLQQARSIFNPSPLLNMGVPAAQGQRSPGGYPMSIQPNFNQLRRQQQNIGQTQGRLQQIYASAEPDSAEPASDRTFLGDLGKFFDLPSSAVREGMRSYLPKSIADWIPPGTTQWKGPDPVTPKRLSPSQETIRRGNEAAAALGQQLQQLYGQYGEAREEAKRIRDLPIPAGPQGKVGGYSTGMEGTTTPGPSLSERIASSAASYRELHPLLKPGYLESEADDPAPNHMLAAMQAAGQMNTNQGIGPRTTNTQAAVDAALSAIATPEQQQELAAIQSLTDQISGLGRGTPEEVDPAQAALEQQRAQYDFAQQQRERNLASKQKLHEANMAAARNVGNTDEYRDPNMPDILADGGTAAAAYVKNRRNNQQYAQGNPGLSRKFGPGGGVQSMPQDTKTSRSFPNPDWTPWGTEPKYITRTRGQSNVTKESNRAALDAKQKKNRTVRVDESGTELQPGTPEYETGFTVHHKTLDDPKRMQTVIAQQQRKRARRAAEIEKFGMSGRDMKRIARINRNLQRNVKAGRMSQEDANNTAKYHLGKAQIKAEQSLAKSGATIGPDGRITTSQASPTDSAAKVAAKRDYTGQFDIGTTAQAAARKAAQDSNGQHQAIFANSGIGETEDPMQVANRLRSAEFQNWYGNQPPEVKAETAVAVTERLRNHYAGNGNVPEDWTTEFDKLLDDDLQISRDPNAAMDWMDNLIKMSVKLDNKKLNRVGGLIGGLRNSAPGGMQ